MHLWNGRNASVTSSACTFIPSFKISYWNEKQPMSSLHIRSKYFNHLTCACGVNEVNTRELAKQGTSRRCRKSLDLVSPVHWWVVLVFQHCVRRLGFVVRIRQWETPANISRIIISIRDAPRTSTLQNISNIQCIEMKFRCKFLHWNTCLVIISNAAHNGRVNDAIQSHTQWIYVLLRILSVSWTERFKFLIFQLHCFQTNIYRRYFVLGSEENMELM